MKKTILLPLFFLALPLLAQRESVPTGLVAYVYKSNLEGEADYTGHCTLLFNPLRSLFTYQSAIRPDSTYRSEAYATPVSVRGDSEGFPIFKDHMSRQIASKIICRTHSEHCIVQDTFGTMQWMLQPEHKRFGQYDCKRATGRYRGRDYEAWYALDIPVPSGPFKFGGLPGLILEIHSTDGNVQFLFNGLEISERVGGAIVPPQQGKNLGIRYMDYVRSEITTLENIERQARASGVEISITRMECIEIIHKN